ncbi:hypothetical protein DSD19_11980 [Rhodovulum sp. BSW8]|uniref:hypothetical protein n=1 Tax=Rhodovulum sp. BSW8 TaxID=2259645 RepID=UPI000DE37C5E|nr:hypothetical protein [Rhodovulum sp. BSW8]RBO52888.1 hypothetical protein DSD19_11980 [Rhodovulum sp. BSW8]
MRPRRTYRLTGGLAAAGLVLFCAAPAAPQDAGGLEARLRFSQRLTQEDSTLSTTTGLGVTLSSRTRTETFLFSVDSGLEQDFDGSSMVQKDPRVMLSYGRESISSALSTDFSYSRTDVDSISEDDDLADGVLELDEGLLQRYSGKLFLELGRDAPFGATVDLGYSAKVYSETSNSGLLDEEKANATLALRFDLDPRITAGLRSSISETDRDDPGQDVRSESVGGTLGFGVTQTLSADAYLGYSRVTETVPGLPDDIQKGLAYTLSFTEQRPNGDLSGSLSSDIDEAGRRTIARIDRNLELPGGALRAGVGVSTSEDDTLRPLLSFAYNHGLPRGTFGMKLDQAFSTDSDGEEALNSNFGVTYRQELTPLSSLQAGLILRDTDFVSDDDSDKRKLQLDLVYRHSLAQDWNVVGGYSHSISDRSSDDREYSSKVFIGLEKATQWRF